MAYISTTPTKLNKSKNNPSISVIIPLYNKAPYIKRALDSVLAQTVQNFEIVVVNDGSTDGSDKIVAGMNDSRIRLINQENQGVSAARNNGVSVAHADLVAFLDADDEWLPEFLETILQLRATYPDAGMYTTGRIISRIQNNKIVLESVKLYAIPNNWCGTIPSTFKCVVHSNAFPATSSSVSIPKKIFLEIGGFQIGKWAGEDWDLWGRISLKYSTAHSSKNLVIIHRDGSSSVVGDENRLSKLDEHPFRESLNMLQQTDSTLQERLNEDSDLLLFLDLIDLNIATHKILSNFPTERKKSRILLKRVKNKFFYKRKLCLLFLSYFPTGTALRLKLFIFSNPKIYRLLASILHNS